jgi:hypothetical protein
MITIEQQRARNVASDLKRDVRAGEQQPLAVERIRDRGGHQQARERATNKHEPDRNRPRVKPVDHPGGVDPCPPDDEQQKPRPCYRHQTETAVDHEMRKLRDREHVHQIEEQLHRRGRLLTAVTRPEMLIALAHCGAGETLRGRGITGAGHGGQHQQADGC